MAFRIGEHVAAGTIENTVRGRVTGTLKIKGYDGVVTLDLQGNAHPDMAGCILQFANPNATVIDPDTAAALEREQKGNAGDISASQKRKVPKSYPEYPEPPFDAEDFVLTNILYLEWFSHYNGRMVIEGVDFDWQIDLPRWQLTDAEIAEQTQQTEDAAGLFMQLSMEQYEEELEELRAEEEEEIDPSVNDEHSWEARLKKSDQRTDALMALLDNAENSQEREELLKKALESGIKSEAYRLFIEEDPKVWSDDTEPDYVEADDATVELAAQIRDESHSLLQGDLAEVITRHESLLKFAVKTRCAVDGFLEEDLEFHEPGEPRYTDRGFVLALIKREIARAEAIRKELGNEDADEWQVCVSIVSEIRDLLVQLSGQLRQLK